MNTTLARALSALMIAFLGACSSLAKPDLEGLRVPEPTPIAATDQQRVLEIRLFLTAIQEPVCVMSEVGEMCLSVEHSAAMNAVLSAAARDREALRAMAQALK